MANLTPHPWWLWGDPMSFRPELNQAETQDLAQAFYALAPNHWLTRLAAWWDRRSSWQPIASTTATVTPASLSPPMTNTQTSIVSTGPTVNPQTSQT